MKKKVDKASAGSGVSRGVKVRVIQLGGGRGQAPSENKTETKQEHLKLDKLIFLSNAGLQRG